MYGATIGKTSIFGIDAATNQACAVGIPDAISSEFLYYFLVSQEKGFTDAGKGGAQPNISQGIVKAWPLLLPPRAEQTRIVAKLEELLSDLDAGVAELKAAQKKLKQYRQSLLKAAIEGALTAEWRQHNPPAETGAALLARILQERRARWESKQLAKFAEQGKTPPKDWQKKYPEPVQPDTTGLPELPQGWVWASIEQIASNGKYSLAIGPFGSNLTVPDYRDSGVPLIFVRNIRSGRYGDGYTKYVTEEKAKELCAHSVQAGDVLITKMGEPPGDADVYPENQPVAIITADCIKVRCWVGLIRPEFLKAVINSYIGKKQIEPITQGVAQKKVSLGRFTGLAVPVAPIEEQDKMISLFSAANTDVAVQEAAINLAIKQSTAQRKNILKAAFSGRLVPQDPNDEPASGLLERIRAEREQDQRSQSRRTRRSAASGACP
ncbi:restriction endonuclease S subunit [Leptothrix ochracea L12]|uniref:Restriction endonuclease S subunit n=2 Tax=Leptothrix ochracea TaxID=735331 RepID=I4Z637_9BURK|nr:restriction endonuclease S subunit [Leptothrix ochracea L12]